MRGDVIALFQREIRVTLEQSEEEGGGTMDFNMVIEPISPMVPLSINDFGSLLQLNLGMRDYSIQQAIEIISSQIIYFK